MLGAIITVGTKGQLVIPAEVCTALDIKPGTRIAVSIDGGRIVQQPVSDRLVDETLGVLKGGPTLATELQKERRLEG